MWRWIVLAFALLFIASRLTRLRPSAHDKKLELLRQTAAQMGLAVRFWTLRTSGYQRRQLPESGYMYYFPWPITDQPQALWAVWLNAEGEVQNIAGNVPALAQQWLVAFRQNFPEHWAMLECSATGSGLLWQERGEPDDVKNIAQALGVLRKNFDVIVN